MMFKHKLQFCLFELRFELGLCGGLKYIDSFLCYRVVINGEPSGWAPVLPGVSQGTVLGSLLFPVH